MVLLHSKCVHVCLTQVKVCLVSVSSLISHIPQGKLDRLHFFGLFISHISSGFQSLLNRVILNPFSYNLLVLVISNMSLAPQSTEIFPGDFEFQMWKSSRKLLLLAKTFQDFCMYHQGHGKALQDIQNFPRINCSKVQF